MTPSAKLELADIVREFGEEFKRSHLVTPEQHAVLRAIERCRTHVMGGHIDQCLSCGHSHPSYNSCRNRHCPKCQAISQAHWLEGRMKRVLPTHYFHVVFTLPSQLRELCKRNETCVYNFLFSAASETLLELGRDPKWLGAELGITTVLHTWTRELRYHPHLHGIVTGGGLASDGNSWRSCKPDYLLPVKVMGALFRGKMISKLRDAYRHGKLKLGSLDSVRFANLFDQISKCDWVVYAKRPFGGVEQVTKYLSRYTHRIGISNQRLVCMNHQDVTFRTKNGKAITLSGEEFLTRFVRHVLPKGFVQIRHYGLLAPSNVPTKLTTARELLRASSLKKADLHGVALESANAPTEWQELLLRWTGIDPRQCPVCGSMNVVRRALEPIARAPPLAD